MEQGIEAFFDWSGNQVTIGIGLFIAVVVVLLKFFKERLENKKAYLLVLFHDLWKATALALTIVITVTIGPRVIEAANNARAAADNSATSLASSQATLAEVDKIQALLDDAIKATNQIAIRDSQIAELRTELDALQAEAAMLHATLNTIEGPLNEFIFRLATTASERSGGSLDRDKLFLGLWDTFKTSDWPLKGQP